MNSSYFMKFSSSKPLTLHRLMLCKSVQQHFPVSKFYSTLCVFFLRFHSIQKSNFPLIYQSISVIRRLYCISSTSKCFVLVRWVRWIYIHIYVYIPDPAGSRALAMSSLGYTLSKWFLHWTRKGKCGETRTLSGASKIDRWKNPVENVSGYRQVSG